MDTVGKQPDCYGVMWDMSAPECGGCIIKKECERSTRRRSEGVPPPPVPVEAEKPPATEIEESAEEATPLKHLLRSLEGKYDRVDRVREHAIAHYYTKDGKNIILITESRESGRIKIQSKGYECIFDSVESLEQAEEILKSIPVWSSTHE
jgi:hypothetical protein